MKFRARTILPDPIVAVGEPSEASHALLPLADAPQVGSRRVALGERALWLYGCVPRWGELLTGEFSIPPARRATEPLTSDGLRRGLVFVSTLPNIEKHACALQIVGLEEHAFRHFPTARICHVSSDSAAHWSEVDDYHSEIRAEGYSLHQPMRCRDWPFAWSSVWGSEAQLAWHTGCLLCSMVVSSPRRSQMISTARRRCHDFYIESSACSKARPCRHVPEDSSAALHVGGNSTYEHGVVALDQLRDDARGAAAA